MKPEKRVAEAVEKAQESLAQYVEPGPHLRTANTKTGQYVHSSLTTQDVGQCSSQFAI